MQHSRRFFQFPLPINHVKQIVRTVNSKTDKVSLYSKPHSQSQRSGFKATLCNNSFTRKKKETRLKSESMLAKLFQESFFPPKNKPHQLHLFSAFIAQLLFPEASGGTRMLENNLPSEIRQKLIVQGNCTSNSETC